ncbi:MAG: M1 family metallopeptidase, partial [Bacteroidota bacterium]
MPAHVLQLTRIIVLSLAACLLTQMSLGQDVTDRTDAEEVYEVAIYDQSDFRATPQRTFDLLHIKLELSFDWEKQWVIGTATLELRPYFYEQRWVTLDAKGLEIKNIKLNNKESTLYYEQDSSKLLVDLGRAFTKEDTITIVVDYIGKPLEYSGNTNGIFHKEQGLYFINADGDNPNKPKQIWTQGETAYNSVWFPTIDHPNERCTQETIITVDSEFKTLSNGALQSSISNDDGTRTDHWLMDQPHAPYLFMLAIGDFAVVKDEYPDVSVTYWVEPEYEQYAKSIFGNTPEMIAFFSELFDYPYPWKSYSQVVVRDFVSGAMENTTASVFMEEVQVDSRTLLDYNWDYIIAHELAHQWFGNLVTCESWSYLTLNEAFANYAESLWMEYKYGNDEADYHRQEELYTYLTEALEQRLELIRYYYEDAEDLFDAHSYSKGGRVLHILREYAGDEAFFEALHIYLSENEYESVEVDQLRLAFEEVTGEDLNWFFDQWFFNPGHPQVEVQHSYEKDALRLS